MRRTVRPGLVPSPCLSREKRGRLDPCRHARLTAVRSPGSGGRTYLIAACECAPGEAFDYGRRLPSQRKGRPSTGCRCQLRSITPRLRWRNRSRMFTRTPVFSRSSISHASLAAQRAHGRHIATSGWLPRWIMRSGSSIDPQHQHRPGGGSRCPCAVASGVSMVRALPLGPLVPSGPCKGLAARARSVDPPVSGRPGRPSIPRSSIPMVCFVSRARPKCS